MGFVKQVGQGLGVIPNDPTAPVDMNAAAAATAEASKKAALFNTQLNRVNQVGPGGAMTWAQGPAGADGSPGVWTQTQSLSPEQQKLYDQQQKTSLGLASGMDAAQERVNSTLAAPIQSYGNDASRKRVEEALLSRLTPQFEQRDRALRTRLLNSGIEVGTDAYNREIQNLGQQQNDAEMQAVLAGGQEEGRQFALESAARSLPLNELNALRTGAQVTPQTFGSYYTGGMANGADYLSAAKAQSSANTAYDQALAGQQAAFGKFLGQGVQAGKMIFSGGMPSGNWGG